MRAMEPSPWDGWVAVEDVYPQVDCGRFPIKRVVGETLEVWADAFKPGHDSIGVAVQLQKPGEDGWSELPMELFANDRWVATVKLADLGVVRYRVMAWTDRFGTMLRGLEKWAAAGEDVGPEKRALAALVEEAASGANSDERGELLGFAREIRGAPGGHEAVGAAKSPRLSLLMWKHAPRKDATASPHLSAVVDRPEAEFASWYEMFPRSQGKVPGRGSTFRECEARLRDISSMGFDVLYLPPIHPIGRTNRRGPNNSPDPRPNDPGSPWAVGSEEGGHDAVDPGLGTIEDFQHLVAEAGRAGMEVALDLAFQCSPDHPYVKYHPEWFYHREDGSIRYAENPPKKYYDIYPLAFDYSLVDPDNRRPVDFGARMRMLESIDSAISRRGLEKTAQEAALMLRMGTAKMYVTALALRYRRGNAPLFATGGYVPVKGTGPRARNLLAFVRKGRRSECVVCAPRLFTELCAPGALPCGGQTWQGTGLVLPGRGPRSYKDVFTGRVVAPAESGRGRILRAAEVFSGFPVALLSAIEPPARA